MYTKAVQPRGTACSKLAPGSSLKSRYIVGVLVYTGDCHHKKNDYINVSYYTKIKITFIKIVTVLLIRDI